MSLSRTAFFYWILNNKAAVYTGLTVFLWKTPTTRSIGKGMASFGLRVTLNTTKAAILATARTPLVRGGSFTLGAFFGSALLGASSGVLAVGAGSYYLESKGMIRAGITKDYLDSHTSFTGLKKVYNVPGNTSTIWNHRQENTRIAMNHLTSIPYRS